MKKRLLSVVLSAVMTVVGIGAGVWEPVTAYAEEVEQQEAQGEVEQQEAQGEQERQEEAKAIAYLGAELYNSESKAAAESDVAFSSIYITSAGALDIGADKESLGVTTSGGVEYYKVQEPGNQLCSGSAADYTFSYSENSHTLTLNNATLTAGIESAISSDYTGELTISLIGNNTVTATTGSAIYLNGNTKVTSEGSGSLTATTTCGWVKYDSESDSLVPAEESDKEAYYPAAIDLGEGCTKFVNDKNTTITAVAQNAVSNGTPSFSAWRLTCGAPGQKYEDDNGNEQECGRLVNYGTINGKINLNDGTYDSLVSCDTQYGKPTDHNYIGKAYYFTKEPLYPNNVVGTLPDGTGRVVGKYNANGEPMPSKVWYQYIYTDVVGSVYTEDRVNPVQFLVYPEDCPGGKCENLLTPADVAAVDDGEEHTFNTDLYAVWHTNGKVTVNGNVTLDVACSSAPKEEWQNEETVTGLVEEWKKVAVGGIDKNNVGNYHVTDGAVCYVKDGNGNVEFQDSSASSVTINGDAGYLSLSDTYQGDVTVNGNINFCALYKDREFLKNWIYRLQWQYDGSPYHPDDVPYCAVPNGGLVVDNGQFTKTVTDLAFAEGVELKGAGLYDGTYFVQTETTMGEGATKDDVAGTSAAVGGNSLLVNVSKKNGLDTDTYPLVRKANATAEQNIRSYLSNRANMVAMDIAVIKQTKDANGDVAAQAKTEPTGTVNLYFDRIDLSKLKNPVLFHIKDNGVIEKLAITKSGSDSASASVKCQTGSFSTYVFAENQSIINNTSSSGGGSYGGGSSGGGGAVSTDTKKDTETVTEQKTVTKNEDGTSTEKTVLQGVPGSTKVTVTANKNEDGKVTSAKASVTTTATTSGKSTISAETVTAIQKTAETADVELTFSVKDTDGKLKYKVKMAAEDLTAGNKLYIYKLDTKTGKYTMVNAKTYVVSKEGSLNVTLKNKATYTLLDGADAKAVDKQILATVKPAKKTASVKQGKQTSFKLSSTFDKENVKSVTYTTAKKSVATISKSGKITAKAAGTVVVKAKVTLKNGKTKTIKMTINVR